LYIYESCLYTNIVYTLRCFWRIKASPDARYNVSIHTHMRVHIVAHIYAHTHTHTNCRNYMMRHKKYGVATISRLLKIIGLFGRISSLLQSSCAKETYNFKEPTICSHPIAPWLCMYVYTYIHVYIYVFTFSHTDTQSLYNESHKLLPLVGSLKLQVSFAEYGLFYRPLLQKRPLILLIQY